MSDSSAPEDESTTTLGLIFKVARIRIGLLQRDAAQRLGVTQSTLSYWEADAYRPSIDDLVRICRLYGLDVADVLAIVASEQAASA